MRRPWIALVTVLACTRPAETTTVAPTAARPGPPAVSGMPVAFEGDQGRFGYRDANGREVLPARYMVAMEFLATGVAFVVDDQGWACIDTTGSVRLRPFVFDNGPDYPSEELFRYVDGDRIGFADLACRVKIPAAWEFAGPFSGQRAPVCRGCAPAHGEHAMPQGGKWGFIDPSGREVIAAEWDFVFPFEDGTARVERRGVPRRIRADGTLVPPLSGVRVATLVSKAKPALLAALRSRRDAIGGCVDEQQRLRPGTQPIARATLAAGTPAAVTIAGDDVADRELAKCLVAALDGIALVGTLTLHMGELPAAATGEPL